MQPKLIALPALALLVAVGAWVLIPAGTSPGPEVSPMAIVDEPNCKEPSAEAPPPSAIAPEAAPQSPYSWDVVPENVPEHEEEASIGRVSFALRYDYSMQRRWATLPIVADPVLKARVSADDGWTSVELAPAEKYSAEARFSARFAYGEYELQLEAAGIAPITLTLDVNTAFTSRIIEIAPAPPRVEFSVRTAAGVPMPAGRMMFGGQSSSQVYYAPLDTRDVTAGTMEFVHEFKQGPHVGSLEVRFRPSLIDWPRYLPSPYDQYEYLCGEISVPGWDETAYATLDLSALPALPPTPIIDVDESVCLRQLHEGKPDGWDESDMAGWDYWAPVCMDDKVTSFGYLRCKVVVENDVAHYRFEEPHWVTVSGRVHDQSGRAVQGAEVRRCWYSGSDYSAFMSAHSDVDGRFEFRLCTHRPLEFTCNEWKYLEQTFTLGSQLSETPEITLIPEPE